MDVQEVRTRLSLVDEALARFEPRDPTPRQVAGIFNVLLGEARGARPDDGLLAGIEPIEAPAGHEAPRVGAVRGLIAQIEHSLARPAQ
jgi:hypothetical protein